MVSGFEEFIPVVIGRLPKRERHKGVPSGYERRLPHHLLCGLLGHFKESGPNSQP